MGYLQMIYIKAQNVYWVFASFNYYCGAPKLISSKFSNNFKMIQIDNY